jgi:SAM-dependent methyltransferase
MLKTRTLSLFALCLPICFAQIDEPKAWQDFLTWFQTQPAQTTPGDIFGGYAASLASTGLGKAEIEERLSAIRKSAAKDPRALTAIHFNKLFASPNPPFRTEPNAFVVRAVRDLKPGKALVPAMGQGRNAVYLAVHGWDVTGYDISDQGLAIGCANAEKAGVKINAVLKSHQDFDFGREQWDLVVMTYHFAPLEDAAFVKRVTDGLRPGGLVVVEQFNAAPGPNPGKGPANALFKSFAGLRVIEYQDTVDVSDWGAMKARIGRIVAQKD